ncbi:MAG: efflux RND transporter periplasmic adaptor subunit [Planctomycetota bacterium]|nr:efflux RND transporter periplasmic adaptor subunit [Planctomycetota bacterium]
MPDAESPTPPPSSMPLPGIGMQIAFVLILVAGIVGFSAGSMSPKDDSAKDKSEVASKEDESPAILVDSWTVKEENRWDVLKEPATIYAVSRVQLSAELEGLVLSNKYQQGDRIEGSGVVITLDGARKALMVQSAQSKVQLLDKRIALLRKQMTRMVKLQGSRTISEDAFDRSQTTLDTTIIEKTLAQNQVAMAQKDLRSMTISGPIGFTVLNRMVEVGERVRMGQPVAQLADLRRVKIACQIGPDSLRFVHELKDAQESSNKDDHPKIQFMIRGLYKAGVPHYLNAKIARISPSADPRTRRYLVELETENPERLLRDGLPAEVIFRRPSTVKEIVIPRETVARAHGLPVVYEIIKDIAKARRIEIITQRGERFLAIKGLKPGVVLVKGGSSLVNDGSKVRVLETRK